MEILIGERCHYVMVSGTHYEVGHRIGRVKKEGIRSAIKSYPYLRKRLLPYFESEEGKRNYEKFLSVVRSVYPQYVKELEGIADGANVDFKYLMLLNLENEFSIILGDKPLCNDDDFGNTYRPGTDGCTDIYLECEDKNTNILVHTEDNAVELLDAAVLVDATIKIDGGDVVERYICFTVAGLLVGNMFGINNHGVAHTANMVFQKDVNLNGIPRRFLMRAMVAAKDFDDIKSIAKISPGIASAYNINVMHKTNDTSVDRWKYTLLEMAASEQGTVTEQHSPAGFHIHVNIFNHLSIPHHKEESSVRRKYVINQLSQKCKPTNKTDILDIVSNQNDKDFPVFRTGTPPDYLVNNATALFDLEEMTMAVYLSKPNESLPNATVNANKIL